MARKLQPKVIITENVSGLLKGNARGYVNLILKSFNDAGYDVQLFLLNSAFMGVPQRRERCFFVAHKKDLKFSCIKLIYNEKPIIFQKVREQNGRPIKQGVITEYLKSMKPTDSAVSDIVKRVKGKSSNFNEVIFQDYRVAGTLTAGGMSIRGCDKKALTDRDCANISTFPQDYEFFNQSVKYICGMSVPPVMMAQVASAVYEQWFKGDKSCQSEK